MKFNWGTGITVFIVLFLAACAGFFIYAQRQRIVFVEDDYYPKELRYEEKLHKIRNVNDLHGEFAVAVDAKNVSIKFPADFRGKELKGKVLIYRPSDDCKDITVPVSVDTAMMQYFPVGRLSRGKYIVKAEWTSEGKSYYSEQEIYIP
jgi:hypothetical protein